MQPATCKIGVKHVSIKVKHRENVPEVEWWDMPFIKDKSKKSYCS